MSKLVSPEDLDASIAEFIDMAKSAHVYFEIVHDRMTVRAVNPDWKMWRPIRYFLDEIGIERVEHHLRMRAALPLLDHCARGVVALISPRAGSEDLKMRDS